MKYALRDKKEMKDSGVEWVGNVPNDWSALRLNSLFQQNKRKNSRLTEDNLLSLSYGKIICKDINTNDGLLPATFDSYQIVKRGYIVLRLTDLQNDKKSLRVGHVNEQGIITSAYLGLHFIAEEQHNSKYFYYLLHAYDLMKVFYNFGAGVRQSLNFNEFKKVNIILPLLNEQKRIADFLDEKTAVIDEVVKKKKKQIELLKEKRAALITQAVTKGLDLNVKMKDSGVEWIGEIPTSWLCHEGRYYFRKKKELNNRMQCDNVLSLTMKGVVSRDSLGEGGLLPDNYSTFQIFQKNDLVFKLIDLENYKTSRVGIVHERGIMSSAYIRLDNVSDVVHERFHYYFFYNLVSTI